MNLVIDYSRDELIDPYAIKILKDRYLVDGEKSAQDAFARASIAFADDEAHAQRLYDHVSQMHFMFATPVLANGGTARGLPISCFLQYVPDTLAGIVGHESESSFLAAHGGGLGASWSALRTNKTKTSRGGESTGALPFIAQFDRKVLAYRQAGTRRAAYAAYLDISHPEIIEFINIRKPSGGDANRKGTNIHNAVNIPDAFMEKLFSEDDAWHLVDPHTGKVIETVSARGLWEQILTVRTETGEPYLHFIDTSNRALPEAQKKLGLSIKTSNLCSEITLPTDDDRTAVCCLSSVNLEKWDEWKDTNMVQDIVRMLDNVLSDFIKAKHIKPEVREAIKKALFSAKRERSIGLGAMGFHSYLQSKMIPFESGEAHRTNIEMFTHLRREAETASWEMALTRGVAPDYAEAEGWDSNRLIWDLDTDDVFCNYAKEKGMKRNMHLIAIAPNASSSILCGNTSPSIEPYSAVSFSQITETGTHSFKNKYFQRLLEQKGLSSDEIKSVWRSVSAKKGSVQHLTILEDVEKAVFKTAMEIDQKWIIEHAATRQRYIDQAQSVNLFFKAPIAVEYLHDVHYSAWQKGLKTLYYCRTKTEKNTADIGKKVERKHLVKEPEPFVQTQFSSVTATGFEITCVGCES